MCARNCDSIERTGELRKPHPSLRPVTVPPDINQALACRPQVTRLPLCLAVCASESRDRRRARARKPASKQASKPESESESESEGESE
jgi:hypothetical protein